MFGCAPSRIFKCTYKDTYRQMHCWMHLQLPKIMDMAALLTTAPIALTKTTILWHILITIAPLCLDGAHHAIQSYLHQMMILTISIPIIPLIPTILWIRPMIPRWSCHHYQNPINLMQECRIQKMP